MKNKDGVFAIVGVSTNVIEDVQFVARSFDEVRSKLVPNLIDDDLIKDNLLMQTYNAFTNGAEEIHISALCEPTDKYIDDYTVADKISKTILELRGNDDIKFICVTDQLFDIGINRLLDKVNTAIGDPFLIIERPVFTNDVNNIRFDVKIKRLDTNTVICAGFGLFGFGSSSGKIIKFNANASGALCGILSKSPVSRSAGYVRYNRIDNMFDIGFSVHRSVYDTSAFNSDMIEILDCHQLVTVRSITGLSGFYITYDHVFNRGDSNEYKSIRTMRTMNKLIGIVKSKMKEIDDDSIKSYSDKELNDLIYFAAHDMVNDKEVSDISFGYHNVDDKREIVVNMIPRFAARTISTTIKF